MSSQKSTPELVRGLTSQLRGDDTAGISYQLHGGESGAWETKACVKSVSAPKENVWHLCIQVCTT